MRVYRYNLRNHYKYNPNQSLFAFSAFIIIYQHAMGPFVKKCTLIGILLNQFTYVNFPMS